MAARGIVEKFSRLIKLLENCQMMCTDATLSSAQRWSSLVRELHQRIRELH
jgi:hypothetical protein